MKAGISDIEIFIPSNKIPLSSILKKRIEEDAVLGGKIVKAAESTMQRAIRFPSMHEDSVTLASEATKKLLKKVKDIENIRYIVTGTETGVDFSKPVSSYVLGLMIKAGFKFPTSLATFQIQHACAGGTLSLQTVASLLAITAKKEDKGIVISTDIARYESPSTAEITQGSGAVALLVEKKAKLIELNLEYIGYSSEDVDDFFRPLNSITAKVKGRYSIECYNRATKQSFEDLAQRTKKTVKEILLSNDIFVFHVPFAMMPLVSFKELIKEYLEYNEEQTEEFLQNKGFYSSLEAIKDIGNTYTASIFISLAFALKERAHHYGKDLIGKKVLICSYGSGNIMALIEGIMAQDSLNVINQWDLNGLLEGKEVDFSTYNAWIHRKQDSSYVCPLDVNSETFYLKEIREQDHYRVYEYNQSPNES